MPSKFTSGLPDEFGELGDEIEPEPQRLGKTRKKTKGRITTPASRTRSWPPAPPVGYTPIR